MKILQYPNLALSTIAEFTHIFDRQAYTFAHVMVDTMKYNSLLCLASNQVGVLARLIVMDFDKIGDLDGRTEGVSGQVVMFNPKITQHLHDHIIQSVERSACLPGIHARIDRFASITIEFQDNGGFMHEYSLQGLASIAIQHAIDHLDGTLFIDRIAPCERILLINKFKKLQKKPKRKE